MANLYSKFHFQISQTFQKFHNQLSFLLFNKNSINNILILAQNPKYMTTIVPKIKMSLNKVTSATNGRENSYQDAIKTLNSLTSNASVIKQMHQSRVNGNPPSYSLEASIKTLENAGLSLAQLDNLNIIHVAGTKGKGTTCAYVESILRECGLRTGFYSSPHLVTVRERIRINGKPLTKDQFAHYFFTIYENLKNMLGENIQDQMPPYFRFLTYMAFYTFLCEKVDVAIIEVGIGGLNDCTNVIRKPIVTGISSLGLDHQLILGNSREEIASAKAGIMKQSVPCYTVPTHTQSVLQVLQNYSQKIKCPLLISPHLKSFTNYENVSLGVNDGTVSELNASLAISLSSTFLLKKFPKLAETLQISDSTSSLLPIPFINGLKNCIWYGRFQTLELSEKLFLYLDGAHTIESLNIVQHWFNETACQDSEKVLIFYYTGFRDPQHLLEALLLNGVNFDKVIFSPLLILDPAHANDENWSSMSEGAEGDAKLKNLADIWTKLTNCKDKPMICKSLDSSLEYVQELSRSKKVSVLVTGSLHLVGNVLSITAKNLF